jgi:hypothetical protein
MYVSMYVNNVYTAKILISHIHLSHIHTCTHTYTHLITFRSLFTPYKALNELASVIFATKGSSGPTASPQILTAATPRTTKTSVGIPSDRYALVMDLPRIIFARVGYTTRRAHMSRFRSETRLKVADMASC